MKDKKLSLIVITVMFVTILLSIYMVYHQIELGREEKLNNAKDEVVETTSLSLAEIMDKIDGYWHEKDASFMITGFLKEDMKYSQFPFASEGGKGGDIKSSEYLDNDIYAIKIMLSPRLLCTEEYCEAGATMGQMSEPEEITVKIDMSNIDNQIIKVDDKELIYLAHTFDEIEKKLYNY